MGRVLRHAAVHEDIVLLQAAGSEDVLVDCVVCREAARDGDFPEEEGRVRACDGGEVGTSCGTPQSLSQIHLMAKKMLNTMPSIAVHVAAADPHITAQPADPQSRQIPYLNLSAGGFGHRQRAGSGGVTARPRPSAAGAAKATVRVAARRNIWVWWEGEKEEKFCDN